MWFAEKNSLITDIVLSAETILFIREVLILGDVVHILEMKGIGILYWKISIVWYESVMDNIEHPFFLWLAGPCSFVWLVN